MMLLNIDILFLNCFYTPRKSNVGQGIWLIVLVIFSFDEKGWSLNLFLRMCVSKVQTHADETFL